MACVDLPAFPLQLLLRLHPDWREAPVAVVERDRPQGLILWVNEVARSARILPGMRYAAGLSLARELRAGVITEQAIAEGIEQVAKRLRFFTPEVEPAPGQPGVFWLGAEGLGLLHATLTEWGAAIRDDLSREEVGRLSARVAIGFSRFGSYAIAKAGLPAVVVVDDAEEEAALVREIPLARLSLEPGFRDTLLLLGIETLGAFLDLPGPEVQRRFGVEVAAFQRAARGDLWAPLQPEALEMPLERRVIFDLPQIQLDLLLASIEELLHALLADLARRGRCLSVLHLTLAVDQPGSPVAARTTLRNERLEPAHPTLDARQLMELIRLRLENRVLSAGVMEVRLDAEWQRATVEQLTLFAERPKRDPRALERALAAVRADLGDGSVVRARLREAHLPEARFEWEALVQIPKAAPRRVYLPPLVRRFFTRAVPLPLTSRHEPDGWLIRGLEGGAVEERVGPYIIAGGWWRKAVHREYHYVRTARGRWLWVYHDRARRRWFQQGEVG